MSADKWWMHKHAITWLNTEQVSELEEGAQEICKLIMGISANFRASAGCRVSVFVLKVSVL